MVCFLLLKISRLVLCTLLAYGTGARINEECSFLIIIRLPPDQPLPMHCGWGDPKISCVSRAYPSLRPGHLVLPGVQTSCLAYPRRGGLSRPRARGSKEEPPQQRVSGALPQVGLHGVAKAGRPECAGHHGGARSLVPFPAGFWCCMKT